MTWSEGGGRLVGRKGEASRSKLHRASRSCPRKGAGPVSQPWEEAGPRLRECGESQSSSVVAVEDACQSRGERSPAPNADSTTGDGCKTNAPGEGPSQTVILSTQLWQRVDAISDKTLFVGMDVVAQVIGR